MDFAVLAFRYRAGIRLIKTNIEPTRMTLSTLAGAMAAHPDAWWMGFSHPGLRRARCSTRSATAATLAAGLVSWVAISRARVTYCGARMVRRSATSDFWVVVEKRRAVPTFSRLTRAPQSV